MIFLLISMLIFQEIAYEIINRLKICFKRENDHPADLRLTYFSHIKIIGTYLYKKKYAR